MAFRRTAFSLIIISLVTAGIAGIYLWYNFNSRSNLVLVVPKNVDWFYHFQTKQIKGKAAGKQPVYLDSLSDCIRHLPIFRNVKDPGEVGIALFSDVVLFSNKYGHYAAMSVNSEPRLQRFITELVPKEFVGGIIPSKVCNFVKANDRNLYFGWKHKACIFFIPKDTIENLQNTESALSEVFNEERQGSVMEIPAVKEFYQKDCDVVFYSKENSITSSHGVLFESGKVEFKYANSASHNSPMLLFSKAGEPAGLQDISVQNMNSYLDLSFKTLYHYLKNFK